MPRRLRLPPQLLDFVQHLDGVRGHVAAAERGPLGRSSSRAEAARYATRSPPLAAMAGLHVRRPFSLYKPNTPFKIGAAACQAPARADTVPAA